MGRRPRRGETGGRTTHAPPTADTPTQDPALAAKTIPADANLPSATTLLGQQALTYNAASNLVAMSPSEIGSVGGSQAHLNMQPFLVLSFCIALQGIFPSQT